MPWHHITPLSLLETLFQTVTHISYQQSAVPLNSDLPTGHVDTENESQYKTVMYHETQAIMKHYVPDPLGGTATYLTAFSMPFEPTIQVLNYARIDIIFGKWESRHWTQH